MKTKPLAGALAALLMCSAAQAANFGHSRIVSALGQPLRIDVPVTQLSADDLRSISVTPAPAAAWAQAGLTPPVDLGSLQTRLANGFTAGTKVIQVRSAQVFDKPVADLLLDVKTATGQQRYQVSLLTHAGTAPLRQAGAPAQSQGGSAATAGSAVAGLHGQQGTVRVRAGDTMFAVARRHAVPGVTVYQMMIALQRANPQAFIENNVNLVKAGATLSMPDMAGLTAISDREARRIFQQQAQAFALYRQRAAGQVSAVAGQEGAAARGLVSSESAPSQALAPVAGPRDQLRLSGGQPATGSAAGAPAGATAAGSSATGGAVAGAAGAQGGALADQQADDRLSVRKDIKESEARLSQLEQNVKNLNQALRSQGEAAKGILIDGVKGLGLSLAEVANAVTGGATGSESAGGAAAGAPGVPGATGTPGTTGVTGAGTASEQSGVASAASGNALAGVALGSGTQGGNAPGSSAAPSSASNATPAGTAPGSAASVGNTPTGNAPVGTASASDASGSGTQGGNASGSSAAPSSASNATPAGTAPGSAASVGNIPTGNAPVGTASAGDASSSSTQGGNAPGSAASSSASNAAPVGTMPGGAAPAANTPAGNTPTGSTPAGAAPASNAPASQSASGNATPNAAAPAAASSTASKTTNNTATSDAGRADGVAQPISNKAEKTVSWIQEHMLGVITGLLALIVLIIAWILRRANAARDDDHGRVVTETMVQEKLDKINLDFEQPPTDESSIRKG